MLKKGEPEFDFTLLEHRIGTKLANGVLSALSELLAELVPKHAEHTRLVNAYWDDLISEVSTNSRIYSESPHSLAGLVDQFGKRWKTPLHRFEIIYSINNLQLDGKTIRLLGVEFFSPAHNSLVERSIPKSEIERWADDDGFLTLASVEADASSALIAHEAGRDQLNRAVILMRTAALRALFGKTATDEFMQWEVSKHYCVRPAGTTDVVVSGWGFEGQIGPFVIELGDDILYGSDDLKLNYIADLPGDIRDRIIRSLYWVAYSTSHQSDDHKIVDLCTALEILLLPEGRRARNKGALIALRFYLLGGDLDPGAVKWMYDRRNDVIHGNALPVVGPRETWTLRGVCYTAVKLVIRAAAAHEGAVTLGEVIYAIETVERLEGFLMLNDYGVYKDRLAPAVIGEARRRLTKRNANDR